MSGFLKKVTRRIDHFICVRSPISIRGTMVLPEDLAFESHGAKNRGKSFDGEYFSWMHEIPYSNLPTKLLEQILDFWPKVQRSMGGKAVLRPAVVYRTSHIPDKHSSLEAFAEAWHRDTTGIPNIQIFVLLQKTDSNFGPLQYIPSEKMKEAYKLAPDLLDKKMRSKQMAIPQDLIQEFTGERGDFLVLNTYSNFHRATIPKPGNLRDMISITFEPVKLTEWDLDLTTSKKVITQLIQARKQNL
jgi:hypothetical protein